MLLISLQDFHTALTKEGFTVDLQKETNQLALNITIGGVDYPAFIRLNDQGKLLQLLVFLPMNYKKGTQSDLARLLHLLNKQLDTPGFGLDEENSLIFYRLVLPLSGGIQENTFDDLIKLLKGITQGLSPIILAVATGATTFHEVVQQTSGLRPSQDSG